MSKQEIIERTVKIINLLPDEKAAEISDFADFVIKRYEDHKLMQDLKTLAASKSFEFLENEEELYFVSDIKASYND